MIQRILLTLSLVLVLGILPAYAGDAGSKGASSKAYEHASDQSIFNRIGDWFSTIGKSDEEKELILQKRREARAARQAEQEARKTERKEDEARRTVDDRSEKMHGKEQRQRVSHGDERWEDKEMREVHDAKPGDDETTVGSQKTARDKEKDSRPKKEKIRQTGKRKGY